MRRPIPVAVAVAVAVARARGHDARATPPPALAFASTSAVANARVAIICFVFSLFPSSVVSANTFSTCFSSTLSLAPSCVTTATCRRRTGAVTTARTWRSRLTYAIACPTRTSSGA
jgi:hypothetical protein